MIREMCEYLATATDAEIDRVAAAIAGMPLKIGGDTYVLWRGAYYLTTSIIPAEPRPYTKFQGGVFPVADRIVTHMTWAGSEPATVGGFAVLGPIDDNRYTSASITFCEFAASHSVFGAPVTGSAKMAMRIIGKFNGVELRSLVRIKFLSDDGLKRKVTWCIFGAKTVLQMRSDGHSRAAFDRFGGLESTCTVAGNVTTERRQAKMGPEQSFMPRIVTTRLHGLLTRIVHQEFRMEDPVTTWHLHLEAATIKVSRCGFADGIHYLHHAGYVYKFRETTPTTFEFLGKIEI